MQYQHPLIRKAIVHYQYNEPVDVKAAADKYFENYRSRYKNYKRNKYDFSLFYGTLLGLPESTHSAAKKMLWQGDGRCWMYFERTAVFWTISHINDEWIDHLKNPLEYALFVERNDLMEVLIQKAVQYMDRDVYQTSKEHKQQLVYPSTYLVHFLIKQWMGQNPALERVLQFGKGYDIYQPLVDHWDDYRVLESGYWDKLCEYHLNQLSLTRSDKRDGEEFIGAGLVPMEFINLFKVRKRLGLDVPEIRHELFQTPMAAEPVIPTGYKERLDIIFQTVKRTAETRQELSAQQVMEYIRESSSAAPEEILY